MNQERFEWVYRQGRFNSIEVLVDKLTGVNYLYVASAYGSGLTPLLNENGEVIIKKKEMRSAR